jgi:hypothetical protein
MKITKSVIKRIIKEEYNALLSEAEGHDARKDLGRVPKPYFKPLPPVKKTYNPPAEDEIAIDNNKVAMFFVELNNSGDRSLFTMRSGPSDTTIFKKEELTPAHMSMLGME